MWQDTEVQQQVQGTTCMLLHGYLQATGSGLTLKRCLGRRTPTAPLLPVPAANQHGFSLPALGFSPQQLQAGAAMDTQGWKDLQEHVLIQDCASPPLKGAHQTSLYSPPVTESPPPSQQKTQVGLDATQGASSILQSMHAGMDLSLLVTVWFAPCSARERSPCPFWMNHSPAADNLEPNRETLGLFSLVVSGQVVTQLSEANSSSCFICTLVDHPEP